MNAGNALLTGRFLPPHAGHQFAAHFARSLSDSLTLALVSSDDDSIAPAVREAWLAELFDDPKVREKVLGYTQAFSSIGGLRGSRVLGAYAISKAADMQMVRNLAMEYGVHNIRANAIAPGLIQTDFARALWEDPEFRKRSEAQAPLNRIGQPEEIAGLAVYMAASEGSFLTGQTIAVDGGVTISGG